MSDCTGMTAVVTGGSAGVGLEVARLFLAAGGNVAITGRNAERLREASEALGAADRVMTASVDVGDIAAGRAMLTQAETRFGGVHVLVNNAGCNVRGALEEREPEDLARIVDTNLKAPILLCRAVLPYMRRAGRGAIVNVASLAGRVPLPDEATYCATKFGLRAFSLALADELRETGINVSIVSPGPIDTGFIMDDLENTPALVFSQPMSTPVEVAQDVLACIGDGKVERVRPRPSAWLTTAAYLLPGLGRALRPMLERRGHKVREQYRRAARGERDPS